MAILVLELTLAFFQPYTDMLNFHAAFLNADVMTSMVNGTFVRNNVFLEFITPIAMIVTYLEFKRKAYFQVIIISLLIMFETYNSGVRTPLVAFLLILIYTIYKILGYKIKSGFGKVIVMLAMGLFLYGAWSGVQLLASYIGTSYTKNATNSSERQMVLLSTIEDADFVEKQTTLGLSFVVMSTFAENPIVGSGKLFQEKGYGGYISRKFGNETDATLAIFLCETGIIGLLLLLYIYFVVLSKIGKGYILPKLIFFYLLIITIADSGIFFIGNVISIFIAIKICDDLKLKQQHNQPREYEFFNARLQKVL